jgi:hypothetical protein
MRPFSELEGMNVSFMENKGLKFALVNLTENILNKGLFDATKQIATFLKESEIHDFSSQKPGEKVQVSTHFLTFKESVDAVSSLYRAGTRGDKRMWFGKETYEIVDDDDICAILVDRNELFVINISNVDVEFCFRSSIPNPIKSLLLALTVL